MSDPSQDIKNESRTIQQRIHELEMKITDLGQNKEEMRKIVDIEEKISRIEYMLADKLTHMGGMMEDITRLMADIKAQKEKVEPPEEDKLF